MKDSEKEEARSWLERLTHLYEQNEVAIREIAGLQPESSQQEWDKTFSNANVSALIGAIEPTKSLPRPKPKELRKIKKCYTDLVACCLKAGHLYLKAYYAGDFSCLRRSQMMAWASLVNPLLKDFLRDLDRVRQEIEVNK
jgi:hypothetical protein